MITKNISLATAVFSLAWLFQGCAKTPTDDASAKNITTAPAADTQMESSLRSAQQLHRDASGRQRISTLSQQQSQSDYSIDPQMPGLGSQGGIQAAAFPRTPGSGMGSALLKPAAPIGLSKRAAVAATQAIIGAAVETTDSAWFRYDDSAHGIIQHLRDFSFVDSVGTGKGRDSIVYQWPYSAGNPAVLYQGIRRTYTNGYLNTFQVFDEDGDGFLNQAPAGKLIKLRKEWVTTLGDTVWKSVTHTQHGQTNFYDSLGAGTPSMWTDSLFVKGKSTWWQRTTDGDGDGFVLTHAAGKTQMVLRDSYHDNEDGTFLFSYEILGAGPDGDYLKTADNERFPFQEFLVDKNGKDLVISKYGDADGDGFYWSPAAGAVNQAFVSRQYAVTDTLVSRHDSLMQVLPAAGSSDGPKVSFYTIERKFVGGITSTLSMRVPKGSNGVSGTDTVQMWERQYYAGYVKKNDADPLAQIDSTLEVFWLIPNDFSTPKDDKITRWYAQTFYKEGLPRISTAEYFTPDAPFSPGEKPNSGTSIHEETLHPVSSKSVVRSQQWNTFNLSGNQSAWKEIRFFESGDSTVASGMGSLTGDGAYAQDLGPQAKNSGWHDAATGEFKDTLVSLDANGNPRNQDVTWGNYDPAKGVGDYYRRGSGKGADTTEYHIVVTATETGYRMTKTGGAVSATIDFAGDSATWSQTVGTRTKTFTWAPEGSGAFAVHHSEVATSDGSVQVTGDYVFGLDGSGSGTVAKYANGVAGTAAGVQFRSDGAVFLNGVMMP